MKVELEAGVNQRRGYITEDGPELVIAGASVVEDDKTRVVQWQPVFGACRLFDDREERLVVMVREKEVMSRGVTTPRLADGAAAERVLGWQPGEYLAEDDRLRQVVQDSRAPLVRHCVIDRLPDGRLVRSEQIS
jgi:hypothetical protein